MSEIPAGLAEALAGRYAIERELGEGGMATVYLAHDVRHDRHVALKVLKPELGAIVGSERFLAEIRTTAKLQHPHILALFDSGEVDNQLFYVMPFVEGESLRDRLDRETQLSIDDAVTLTGKVADALDYAHEHGVVHRDIKPANILITERGEPLVADFGIALAISEAGGGRITETGLSLGTPHYMSPEQATGDRDIDPRSDIYALGCVLYEMLAGQPPFVAPTAQGVLVRILTEHPHSITDLRHTVPPHVAGVIARALEKLPADRFPNAGAFKAALADEGYRYQAIPQPAPDRPAPAAEPVSAATAPTRRKSHPALLAALAVAVVAAAAGWFRSAPEAPAGNTVRAAIDLAGLEFPNITSEIVISPDGSKIAVPLKGGDQGSAGLFVRNAEEADFRLIPGTEGAEEAAFSPDGTWLVYMRDRRLFKISVEGGSPQPLVQSAQKLDAFFPSWSEDGWIYFSNPEGIHRVRETGGVAEQLGPQRILLHPRALPGGSRVLFTDQQAGSVAVLDLATDSVSVVVTEALDATYVGRTGDLLWVDPSAVMWAAPFNPETGALTGERSFVLDDITQLSTVFARYSVSRDGTLVYSTGGGGGRNGSGRELVIADLDGSTEPVELEPRDFGSPRWSPDGRRVAFSAPPPGNDGGDEDIYVYDVELQTAPRRLTNDGDNSNPVWSPGGDRIVFSSNRKGARLQDLFVRGVDTDEPARMLLTLTGSLAAADWPEDDLIVFSKRMLGARYQGLYLLQWGDADSVSVREYYVPEAGAGQLRVSPDGSLAAYASDESGQGEVYIRSFPDPRGETVISEGGGSTPQWSPNGSTLYYKNRNVDSLYAARIEREPTPAVIIREALRPIRWGSWDLHPDGDRLIASRVFVAGTGSDEAPSVERHFIVTNWFPELRERTGGN